MVGPLGENPVVIAKGPVRIRGFLEHLNENSRSTKVSYIAFIIYSIAKVFITK